MLLSVAGEIVGGELLIAPTTLVPARLPPAEAQRALWRVRSLAASAAKLTRCLPLVPAMEAGQGSCQHRAQRMMERVAELACTLLVQQPDLVPGPTDQLTDHLRWGSCCAWHAYQASFDSLLAWTCASRRTVSR